MSTSRNSHWCYSCRQTVSIEGRRASCGECGGGFVEELNNDTIHLDSSTEGNNNFGDDNNHGPTGFMDTFMNFMRDRIAGRGLTNLDSHAREANTMMFNSQTQGGSGYGSFAPWLIFRGQTNDENISSSLERVLNEAIGFRNGNGGDYFVGPGVPEFIEELTRGEHHGGGAPPASRSTIDAIPCIRISHRHVRSDPYCAICTDKFKIGCYAKEMPCNHIYHPDCIGPWLEQHNSCPVCRQGLPPQSRNNNRSSSSSSSSRMENPRTRNVFSSIWPFKSRNINRLTGAKSSSSSSSNAQQFEASGYPTQPF
ncbi:probable E3 ubiquitin-protein ligase RHC1A [Impatiens glandulifera]|uniref:probable E3 ubiquitin-protein ligase RHC1A n=1 Tax=Impatiens glandulifera TaxID=253017 RepID=UPI001FB11485|nr:probable E3 ubiquitin-protein ligase RHC1A [Impatiens glandulifera]XP_047339052.1 probable E3 ubiquitin-protein ligase RHC1A [Impatiens glandulifera]XP_047339053.1 probable E3 ubiquitin-protein ligase RHC1A [Impatiens glandulifera]